MTLINLLISTIIFSLITSVTVLFLYFMPQLAVMFGGGVYVGFVIISLVFTAQIMVLAKAFKRG